MKKLWGVVALLLLCAVPASAQESVVAKYRANYPTPMTAEHKVDLLRHVAVDVHGGLLRKPDGTNCGGYSCDVICFSDGVLFDVLEDQDAAATPRWNPTSNPRGYRCELVAADPVIPGSLPSPPAIPSSGPNLDLGAVLAKLDAIYQQNERIYADETNQRTAQTATLKAAIDEPGFLTKIFGNRYVQLALAGLGTYLMTERFKK